MKSNAYNGFAPFEGFRVTRFFTVSGASGPRRGLPETSHGRFPEERLVQKSLHIDPAKCTGCLQCEMACSYENYQVFNPSKSRIKVFDFHHTGRKVPYTCTQCDEAWCLHACPVEAIKLDAATGAKVVLEAVCVGCKVCTIACPFGTVNYVQETGKVQKCDLCGGNPACAEACPTGAITYVDADWTGLDRMRQWAGKLDNQPAAGNAD
jgi:anaerobic carbon-monoxide dehydrogenase iron sulfur subunit